MRLLFFKRNFEWPIRAGATVHSGNLMRALVSRGHEVQLWTEKPVGDDALHWLGGVEVKHVVAVSDTVARLGWWANRFSDFWGNDRSMLFGLQKAVQDERPDVVIFVGPDTLPAASLLPSTPTVWYSADDPVLHQLSLGKGWRELRAAFRMALYELSLHRVVDATWVVSEQDRRWSKMLRGRCVAWLPNGVDTQYFTPQGTPQVAKTCVFWGNLAFRPNEDAVRYWLDDIWPGVLAVEPDARFWICGCNPSNLLRARIAGVRGVEFFEDLPDLRPKVCEAEIAVFPLISGAGVKNKVLEAAAMRKPIVCTPRCRFGLAGKSLPLAVCRTAADWRDHLTRLWNNPNDRVALATLARNWVQEEHQWSNSAAIAERSLMSVLRP